MFNIVSGFSPIRAVEGQKDPVILEVILRNKDEKSKLATVTVKIPYSIAFDKTGLVRDQRKRIGFIRKDQEKTVPFVIYLKPLTKEGEYPVEIKVEEHDERYDRTEKQYSQTTSLRVIKR